MDGEKTVKIGIIGAGFVGSAIGKLALRHGHEAMLSNSRGPHTLFSLSRGFGLRVGTVEEAVAFGEAVVVGVPLGALAALPAAALAGKVVIDANNYYPERDGQIAELDDGTLTTGELLARHLPGARVVKAFNAIRMAELETDGRPAGSPERRALPVAGDDAGAKAVAVRLLEDFGFDAVDAGPLAECRRFENGTPVYCRPLGRADLARGLAAAAR